MEIRQCHACSKLFAYRGNSNCPDCIKKHDDEFTAVRRFLLDNPKTDLDTICEECEVSRSDVLGWVREGRLVLNTGAGVICEKCGDPISHGRFCKDCSQRLVGTLESAHNELKRKEEENKTYGGMHTNRDNKR